MNPRHPSRLAGLLLAPAALLAALLAPLPHAAAGTPGSCGRPSGCTKFELLHSGSTYAWYPAAQRYEFKTPSGSVPPSTWHLTGSVAGWVAGKPGSGTLKTTTGTSGDVVTDWSQPHRTGRWEVRFRSVTKSAAGLPDYGVRLDLVPTGAPVRCAPESITMVSYDPATDVRSAAIGLTRPGLALAGRVATKGPVSDHGRWTPGMNQRTSAWHEWAVEVAKDHISWFVDGSVVRRERRPAALIGKPLHLRIALLAEPGARMAPTTTQLDWARYWTMKRTTKKKAKVRALKKAAPLTVIARPLETGC